MEMVNPPIVAGEATAGLDRDLRPVRADDDEYLEKHQ